MKATVTLHFEKAEEWVNEIEDGGDPGEHILNILSDNKIPGEILGKVKYEEEKGEHTCGECKIRITKHSTKICDKCRADICDSCTIKNSDINDRCSGCEIAGE